MEQCEVLVIGGGPAGSTAAALLAEQGRDVLLVEKDAHPRFHVGESLLPRNLPILQRLGLYDDVARMGVYKPGAEFVSDACGRSVAFPFSWGLNKEYVHSYQVRRSEFDALLFANAAKRGARVAERTRVTAVEREGDQTRATLAEADGTQRVVGARFVLDASGRDTLMASKLRLKQSNKRQSTAAVFGHFHGVEQRSGDTEGYISVHLAEDGWFWMIPLPEGVTSVGFVGNQSVFKGRQGSAADLLMARIRSSPTVNARMAGAESISAVTSTGNYSYQARTAWGEGYFMIGDAFAFIDPVFSSGVLFAMSSAELGAQVATAWLEDQAAFRGLARRAERRIRREMASISWLIHRINTPVLRAMFMAPKNTFRMRDGLVSMLGGNLGTDLRSRLPILAFKSVFYAMSAAERLGVRFEAG